MEKQACIDYSGKMVETANKFVIEDVKLQTSTRKYEVDNRCISGYGSAQL